MPRRRRKDESPVSMTEIDQRSSKCQGSLRALLFGFGVTIILVGFFLFNVPTPPEEARTEGSMKDRIKTMTWNIAAINNNPFEYWITTDDSGYSLMMVAIQNFINQPASKDVDIAQLFTAEMVHELQGLMEAKQWKGVEEAVNAFNHHYKHKSIINGFLKDRELGLKRLVSMPDRSTNTINLMGGRKTYRPTVINCYGGKLDNIQMWWKAWKQYMFEQDITLTNGGTKKVSDMLSRINRIKYPALSEKEEAMSLPLQTIILAVFDMIMVHMLSHTAPGKWQELRSTMCANLNFKKVPRTLEIIGTTYANADIVFLQEVSSSFTQLASVDPEISKKFHVLQASAINTKRDQNSVILISRENFRYKTIREATDLIEAEFGGDRVPVSNGDIFAIRVKDVFNREYMLVSFHGDTNGLATIPVLQAVHMAMERINEPDLRLIFGLDANTYKKGDKKRQDMEEFVRVVHGRQMRTCWGNVPNPSNFTTFNARTFLQPQLNKAVKLAERDRYGDKNPKDFIIFYKKHFKETLTTKDNTGQLKYVENMVFPTLEFPSDHGILSTTLEVVY